MAARIARLLTGLRLYLVLIPLQVVYVAVCVVERAAFALMIKAAPPAMRQELRQLYGPLVESRRAAAKKAAASAGR